MKFFISVFFHLIALTNYELFTICLHYPTTPFHLSSKYSPQHPVIKHPQSFLFPWGEGLFDARIKTGKMIKLQKLRWKLKNCLASALKIWLSQWWCLMWHWVSC